METNQLSPTPLTTVMKTRDFIIMFISKKRIEK